MYTHCSYSIPRHYCTCIHTVAIAYLGTVVHVYTLCIHTESFYDDHTLEGPFHGNITATLFCPLLYKYNHSTYSVYVPYTWCVWVCNSTHWVYSKRVGLVEDLQLSTEGGNSDNTCDPPPQRKRRRRIRRRRRLGRKRRWLAQRGQIHMLTIIFVQSHW